MIKQNQSAGSASRIWDFVLRYTAALAASGLALAIWFLSPMIHRDPFSVFLVAVVICAHFLGFGPALLCTAASAFLIDYYVFAPSLHFSFSGDAIGRLTIFLLVAILVASLARQRSRAERTTQTVERQMAAIVESSEDAIFSATPDGIITSWNRGAEALYGYKGEEIVGQHISTLAPPDRAMEVHRNTGRLQRGEHIASFQTERMRKDGSRVTVLLSVSPIRDRSGKVTGHSVIARDVTALARAEQALRRNEKLATAGRLATAVAHEINNPLEAITNLLYLARKDASRSEEYLSLAEKEVQRVASIAQQTLGYARERSSPGPIGLGSVLDEVLQLYSRRLDAKSIEVVKRYDDCPEIQGFSVDLRQLFSNLILNAIDALDEKGHLCLKLTRVQASGKDGRSGVRILIVDDGVGIAALDRAHMFEPFFTTKGEYGTGLGLWVSQGLVEKHGGSIRFRSSTLPGRSGTAFSVFLPLAAQKHQAA